MNRLVPKKSLGQHFLRCGWVVSALLHAAELKKEDCVLEIGPGTGVLTRALGSASAAGRVISVEKDEKLSTQLKDVFKKEGAANITIIPGDILRAFSHIANDFRLMPNAYKVVANIPYYLTSRLLRMLLEEGPRPHTIVFSVQKELARRICQKAPHMNLLALSVQTFGAPSIIKDIPARCFYPAPKVDSSILKIERISDMFFRENNIRPDAFFSLAKTAFGHKRKVLMGSLRGRYEKLRIERGLREGGLPLAARPEELSPHQWAMLLKYLGN